MPHCWISTRGFSESSLFFHPKISGVIGYKPYYYYALLTTGFWAHQLFLFGELLSKLTSWDENLRLDVTKTINRIAAQKKLLQGEIRSERGRRVCVFFWGGDEWQWQLWIVKLFHEQLGSSFRGCNWSKSIFFKSLVHGLIFQRCRSTERWWKSSISFYDSVRYSDSL